MSDIEISVIKRIIKNPDEVSKSGKPHPPIISKETFFLVQKMKKKRTNIELDEHVNRIRKSTHYSMKQSDNKVEELVE